MVPQGPESNLVDGAELREQYRSVRKERLNLSFCFQEERTRMWFGNTGAVVAFTSFISCEWSFSLALTSDSPHPSTASSA